MCIKIITGDLKNPSVTTVRAESRRLIFEKAVTRPGRYLTLEATINIRVSEIAGTNEMVIKKPRELNKLDWDEKLTFEFTGSCPCICALEISKNENAVTVFWQAILQLSIRMMIHGLHGGRCSRVS